VSTFYVARMPGLGWTRSATALTVGGSSAPCGYKYCWTKDGGQGTTLIVTLQNIQINRSDTEFTIAYEIAG
jgi:hypothetical protein